MTAAFPTQRTLSQVVRRHTPGSLIYIPEYDVIAQVNELSADSDTDVDKRRLLEHMRRKIQRWSNNPQTRVIGIDIDDINEGDIVALRPTGVYWEPYSRYYQCTNRDCLVLHNARDAGFTGRCRRCDSRLGQIPYVLYHHCGSFAELRPPQTVRCPDHGVRYIYFFDTRKFQTSQWRCRECDYQARFDFPVCYNPECRNVNPARPMYSGSFWRDQWVHYSQTIDYVNLDEALARRFVGSVGARQLVERATLGLVRAGANRLETALSVERACPNCTTPAPFDARFCPQCGTALPNPEAPGGGDIGPIATDDGRTIWTMLRDMENSRSLRDESEDGRATESMRAGLVLLPDVGLWDIVLVQKFPLVTAAIGFTRDRPGTEAWFRAFPKNRDDKNVVYTYSMETEAWLVQLRASTILEWLRRNGFTSTQGPIPSDVDEVAAKQWLIERMAEGDGLIVQPVSSLLHSMSHVVLQTLAVSCGLEASSLGELLLPNALGFALYAGDSELGALAAAFEQSLDIIMASFNEFASCKFDPGCSHDDGGACVGCLHLSRGCESFNDSLSRGYLFGGSVTSDRTATIGFGYLGLRRDD